MNKVLQFILAFIIISSVGFAQQDEGKDIEEVKITIIATGFDDHSSLAATPQDTSKPKTTATLLHPGSTTNPMPPRATRKVVGGDYGGHEDILDVPTFLRKQMD